MSAIGEGNNPPDQVMQVEGLSDCIIINKAEIEKEETLKKTHKTALVVISALSGVGAIYLTFSSESKFEKGLLAGISLTSLLSLCILNQYPKRII